MNNSENDDSEYDIEKILYKDFDPRKRVLAQLKLVELRKQQPNDEGTEALVHWIHHLEKTLAKFYPTHMAKLWVENQRLKDRLSKYEQ